MPEPDAAQVAAMVTAVVDRVRKEVPEAPGALYLRPMLFGMGASIGGASAPPAEAMLIVLASPVWDYFTSGPKPLRIYVEEKATRCASHLGMIKTGGNYAAAMGPTMAARQKYQVDQVLFCPGGEVQETGAANFLLIREGKILTRSLDTTFLHGVTRDSLLTIAPDWVSRSRSACSRSTRCSTGSRTARPRFRARPRCSPASARWCALGEARFKVGSGEVGPHTRRLRAALVAMQQGEVPTPAGWTTRV